MCIMPQEEPLCFSSLCKIATGNQGAFLCPVDCMQDKSVHTACLWVTTAGVTSRAMSILQLKSLKHLHSLVHALTDMLDLGKP